MSLWTIIGALLDWSSNWRFNVCFYSGIVLAILVAANIPQEPLNGIVGVAIVLAGIVVGFRWDNAS